MATGGIPLARKVRLFVLLAVTAAVVALAMPAVAQEGDAASLLKQGLEQVRAGNMKDGIATLRQALALDPTNDQILGALGRAEYSALLGVIASGSEGVNVVSELLNRAMPVLPEKKFKDVGMEQLIQTAVTAEDSGARFDAAVTLARVCGEYAVPGLVAYLGSSNTDHKVNAHITLMNRLGREAVLPLNEALQSSDAGIRRMAVAELGQIGDERSLAAVAEMAAGEGDADAKAKATEAWGKLAARFPYAEGMNASDLYLKLASLYYNGEYRVMAFADRPLAVWRWTDGLKFKETPRHLYVLKLAEEAAYDALRTNPENGGAAALLARILLAEHLSATAVARVLPDDEMAKAALAELGSAKDLVAALGWANLANALNDALDANDHSVAVALLDVMPSVYGSSEFTTDNPIVRATGSSSNAVRMAAAEAVLHFNAVRRITAFPDEQGFLGIVAQAAGELIPRQVLVIDQDDVRRNKVMTELGQAKYSVYDARSGRDGVVRAGNYAGLDLILLSGGLSDMEPLAVISRLQGDERTKNVPIVVLGTSEQAADAKWTDLFKEKAKAITSVPEGPGLPTEAFRQAVDGAFGTPAPDAQMRYMLSARVLDALATTDTGNTLFGWTTLTETLVGALKADVPNDPPVKLNAIRALGNVGDAAAVEGLAEFFGTGAEATLRAATGWALVSICRKGEVAYSEAGFEALLRGTTDADAGVRSAAFAALGASRLTSAQAVKVANTCRPGDAAPAAPAGEGGGSS